MILTVFIKSRCPNLEKIITASCDHMPYSHIAPENICRFLRIRCCCCFIKVLIFLCTLLLMMYVIFSPGNASAVISPTFFHSALRQYGQTYQNFRKFRGDQNPFALACQRYARINLYLAPTSIRGSYPNRYQDGKQPFVTPLSAGFPRRLTAICKSWNTDIYVSRFPGNVNSWVR